MPSPESRGGPPQRGEPANEHEQPPYHVAARFMSEPVAKQAYFRSKELVFADVRADLSVYRFLLDQVSHVAVLGAPPPEEIDNQLRAILSTGEPAVLPQDILTALYERRTQMKQHGAWVEGHYRPGKKLDY